MPNNKGHFTLGLNTTGLLAEQLYIKDKEVSWIQLKEITSAAIRYSINKLELC